MPSRTTFSVVLNSVVLTCILLLFPTQAPTSTTPCNECDGNNVTCDNGVCLLRCVLFTSSGECLQCLDSRFYGKQCEHDCPDTCLNSRCLMNNTHGVCTEGCVAGKKGDNCASSCPSTCSQCEQTGDACIGPCQNDQYYGSQCETPCPDNCLDHGCRKDTGSCKSCVDGYTGEYCNGCVVGYRGVSCNIACPPHCLDVCDKDKGECGSCVAGYTGTFCNETCPSNCTRCEQHNRQCIGPCPDSLYYGPFCSIQCPTSCAGCDKTTGRCILCADGYTQCTDGLCQKGDCDSGNTILTLKVTAGVLAMAVLLGTILAVVILVRRKSKCQHGEMSPRPDIPQDLGQSDSNEYWAQKYWEIHDKESGSESGSNISPVPKLPYRRSEQDKDIPLGNVTVRKPMPYDTDVSPAAVVHQDGHDSTYEPFVVESPQVDVADSVVADAAEEDIMGTTPSNSGPRTNQEGGGVMKNPIQPHIQHLIRKTESIIAIEQHLDLANINVKYLTPDKVNTSSNTINCVKRIGEPF